jgi:hypothetical protein
MLANPASPGVEANIEAVRSAALAVGLIVDAFKAGSNREIDAAFIGLVEKRFEGVLVNSSPLFNNRRLQLATLATRHVMPVIYYDRDFP